jgi:hypothetical protein
VFGLVPTGIAGGTVALVGVSMTVTLLPPLFGTYRNGPCCAWAPSVVHAASAPSQTPPSSAARVIPERMGTARQIDLLNANASGTHRRRGAQRHRTRAT